MEFNTFNRKMQKHFEQMYTGASALYTVDCDMDELWNLYLDSFPAGKNEIYRTRREFDCSCCRHFMKQFGNVVAIKDAKVISLWDFRTDDDTYQPVLDALSAFVHSKKVSGIYKSKDSSVGTAKSHEYTEKEIVTWNHFYVNLPNIAIHKGYDTIGTILGNATASYNVFSRSLKELTQESVEVVLELIAQNSLYRGEEWNAVLQEFLKYKKAYGKLAEDKKDLYCWENSVKAGIAISRIRNHSIGTLLIDISEGMDLDKAVRRYEAVVAPANYKRPKAIFTKKMLEDAQKTIVNLGYAESLGRRFAHLDDITVNNILFCNRDSAKKMSGGLGIFDEMMSEVAVNPKKFDRAQEIGIDDFVTKVLPTAKEVEVLFENRHAQNMVSLIAPMDADAPSMFKWNNAFGWAYSGNMTDSDLKRKVGELGGRTDGALRFSHTWNYDGQNQSLMDLHVFMPGCAPYTGRNSNGEEIHDFYPDGRRVGWNHRKDLLSGGNQDVDFVNEPGNAIPVENTVFPDLSKMPDGKYIFKIHNWRERHPNRSGFKAEIECGGELYQFEYDKPVKNKQWITLAEVTLKDGEFNVDLKMPTTASTKTVWGINTNQFVPVSTIMYSPNYWDEQTGNGHRHVFFMLKDCINDENPNGMYNEFLKPELVAHKRVFEALGSKLKVADDPNQLSGVGFSTTKRENLIVKVKGATERVLNVKF